MENTLERDTTSNRKLANTVLYLLKHCGDDRPGVMALLKMLWFADYWHYRKHLRQITDIQYVALQYGPVPDNYKAMLQDLVSMGAIERKEIAVFGLDRPKVEYIALVEPDETMFSTVEHETLQRVILECRGIHGETLSQRTHREGPWQFVWDDQEPGRRILPGMMRWIDNLPGEEDMELARRELAKPEVVDEITRLMRGERLGRA